MKKFTIIIVALFLTSLSFAQKQANLSSRPVNITVKNASANDHFKATESVLNESFSLFPPASWTVNPATGYWVGSSDWEYSEYASNYGDGAFAVFQAFNLDAGEVGYLMTPVLSPVSGNYTLTFDVIEILDNQTYIGAGIELYIEFSTDNGSTWTTSTTNVLTSIANHNTATVAQTATNLSADLSAYIDQSVMVRFRAVSDYGGFDLFLDNVAGPEAAVVLGPTDLVVTAGLQNTMTPVAHASYSLNANVTNTGDDLASNATLGVTVTPGTFTENITIEVPFAYGTTSNFACTNVFTATETGTYTASFNAVLATDPNQTDNTSSVVFDVTESTFATDNGTMLGGGGSNEGTLTFGNIFLLLSSDVVSSFSIGFPEITADQNFTVSIFSVDPATLAATSVFTSGTLTKTTAMSGLITEFDIEDQTLAAGFYLFAVNQLDATNISVGYDGVDGGMVYILNTTDNTIGGTDQLGNVFIRVNMLNEVTPPTTCDLAALFMTSNTDPTPIASSVTIGANDDVTVYPGILNNGPDATNANAVVAVSINGTDSYNATLPLSGEYSIPSNSGAAITPNGYTVTAEEMNTNGLTGTFDVCMTITYAETDPVATNNTTCLTVTRIIDNIENNIANSISIYPNPASDIVTVANAENANIVIVNMIGDVVATVENASAIESINISNLANGTYFVRVNADVFKFNVVK